MSDNNKTKPNELPPIDIDNLIRSLKDKFIIELLFAQGYIEEKHYYSCYSTNAEVLERDFRIMCEIEEIDTLIEEEENKNQNKINE